MTELLREVSTPDISSNDLGGIGGGIGSLLISGAVFFHSVLIGVIGLMTWFALLVWTDWYLIPFRQIETD